MQKFYTGNGFKLAREQLAGMVGGRKGGGRETVVLWTYLDAGYLTGEIPTLPNGFVKCVIIHH